MKHRTHLIQTALVVMLCAGQAFTQDAPRRITQTEAIKSALSKPQPEYPPIAHQLKVEGRVDLEVSIAPDGTVENVKILTGDATLTGAAVNALKRWRFEPFAVDGKPGRAVAVISFTFKL